MESYCRENGVTIVGMEKIISFQSRKDDANLEGAVKSPYLLPVFVYHSSPNVK